jgi:hypothetical protein
VRTDFWDKLDIVFKVLASLAVAVVGSVGSWYLQSRQQTETKVQLYAELMSNRERADSDLRKETFNSIIKAFLEPKAGGLEEQVLALELLTYNFHDVVDLGPLFKHMESNILTASEPERQTLERRLQKTALEVINKQLAALTEVSEIQIQDVYFEDLEDSRPRGITVLDEELCLPTEQGKCERSRKFLVHVLDADEKSKQLQVHLEISPAGRPREVEAYNTFWVAFSDFPLIDNTRLKDGDRVGIVLRRWEEGSAELACAYFPGSRASFKDKLYYDEVVELIRTRRY